MLDDEQIVEQIQDLEEQLHDAVIERWSDEAEELYQKIKGLKEFLETGRHL